MPYIERERGSEHKKPRIHYSSKLLAALNKFANVITTEVKNPLVDKYGDAYEHLIQGDAHRLRDETEDAIRAYEKALVLNPELTEAYLGMAKCFKRKGDLKRAILAFKKALAMNAFDKQVHLELGKIFNESGMPTKGIAHLRQAIKLDPNFVEAKFNLALCLELQGDLGEPTRLYEEIIDQEPDFLPAYNNLGSIYMRQGFYHASEKMFRQLIDMAPEFSRGYLGLAISLDRANRPHEALGYYEKLLVMKAHSRNKEFIEERVVSLRKTLGRRPRSTASGNLLVRVK